VKPILAALRVEGDNGANAPLIKGMAHITGGGLTENIPRVLPGGLAARLNAGTWELLPVFRWLGRAGRLDTAELARTFNCGIGLVIVTAPEHAGAVMDILAAQGEDARVIGEVAPRAEGADAVVIDHAGSWA